MNYMKHLYNISLLLAVFIFAACSPEVDDLFNETASERINKAIKEDLNILQNAKNGWVIEYYPSPTKMYGGFTILTSFDDKKNATVSCDLFASDKKVTSLYDVKQSTGLTLTFDTYNEIFHLFSAPLNNFGIGNSGKGMEGDYEFLILECTPEKVRLKGKKTGTTMLMTPLPENKTWKEYLDEVKAVPKEASPALYDVKVGTEKKYDVEQLYHKFVLTHEDGTQEDLPFVYTTDGIKFYEPIDLGNAQMQSLTWDKERKAYVNGDIAMEAFIPEGYKSYDEYLGTYLFYYNSTKRVTLSRVENDPFNTLYTMKGFPSDILMTYDAAYGRITLQTQPLYGNVYLCVWGLAAGGNLTNLSGAGMVGINDNDGAINFKDNGVWGNTDSFIAYDLKTGQSIFQIPYVKKMVKQ